MTSSGLLVFMRYRHISFSLIPTFSCYVLQGLTSTASARRSRPSVKRTRWSWCTVRTTDVCAKDAAWSVIMAVWAVTRMCWSRWMTSVQGGGPVASSSPDYTAAERVPQNSCPIWRLPMNVYLVCRWICKDHNHQVMLYSDAMSLCIPVNTKH